ncbi:MAG: peptide chain release factor N(5)-glutamine methyltransferase [Methylomonas sp.]
MADSIRTVLADAMARLTPGSETAVLDAEVLLGHCLGRNRAFLRAWPEHRLNPEQQRQYADLIAQRQAGMPVAYLIGRREFWSRNFRVNPDVLIPRADSELLVELCLQLIPEAQACKILDLGAGAGILAITLAAERPEANVLAVDICPKALDIAASNARALNVPNVRFLLSDWTANVADKDFDIIISNPPYIAATDPHLRQGDLRFEPELALISPDNGLKDIRMIASQSCEHLKIDGHLLIEHGYNQPTEVQAIFAACHYETIRTHADLSGQPRVTRGVWKPL